MKVIVNGVEKELCLLGENGIEWTQDFIGNEGALMDGQFTWDEEKDAFIADEYTFDWWEEAIQRETANEEKFMELSEIHGIEKVSEVVNEATYGYNNLEDIQKAIANALAELE